MPPPTSTLHKSVPSAFEEPRTFPISPPDRWGWTCQVDNQRKHIKFVFVRGAPELTRNNGITVDGYDTRTAFRCENTENPVLHPTSRIAPGRIKRTSKTGILE